LTLATFNKFKVKIPGVSIELVSSDESQFTDPLTSSNPDLFGHYCMSLFEMKNYGGVFTARERGMFGVHYINSTSGALDTSWIAADFAAAEAGLQTFWSSQLNSFSTDVRLVEHRWYPYGPGYHGSKSNPIPPSRVTTLATPLVGTSASVWVHQVCTNLTMRTTLRKHWGRVAMPLIISTYSNFGQATSGNVDTWATLWKTATMAGEASNGVVPVIYDRVRHQVYGITAFEADSVPDIQRRRRPRDPGYKKILTS
jgi:hypothetical protein